jgi:hypothetical protein
MVIIPCLERAIGLEHHRFRQARVTRYLDHLFVSTSVISITRAPAPGAPL